MGIVQNRNAVMDALQDGALTRDELKAKLAENGQEDAYRAVLQMSDSITWRMVSIDGEAMPQYALKSEGFEPTENAPTE